MNRELALLPAGVRITAPISAEFARILTPEALAFVQEVANREGVFLDMAIEPGDIQFLNNRTTVHGRTDYREWPEPERQRVMFRLWLMCPDPTINAVDDDYSASPINGGDGGTTASIIGNDTTNGVAAVIGTNVTLTPGTGPTPTAGSLTMIADGTITVASGTTVGTYTYPYTICTIPATTPTPCDTATATIVVTARRSQRITTQRTRRRIHL